VDREAVKEFTKDWQAAEFKPINAEWHTQGDGYSPSPDTNSLPTTPVVCNFDSPVITTLKREPHHHTGVPTPPYGRASTSLEVIASKVRVLEGRLEDAKKDVLYYKELLLREEIENRSLNDHLQYQLLKADAHRMVWSAREYLGVNYPDSRDAQAILTDVFQELSASGINYRAIRGKYQIDKLSRQKAISFCCQKPLKEEIIPVPNSANSILYLACSACGKLWVCKGPVEGTVSDV
jgi:hypothetical protein